MRMPEAARVAFDGEMPFLFSTGADPIAGQRDVCVEERISQRHPPASRTLRSGLQLHQLRVRTP